MNERQRRFCELYARNPDGTAAALAAGYSPQSAASIGSENLRKPELLQYIRTLQEQAAAPRIAGISEARAFLSDVMRDAKSKTADRVRAAELLMKAGGCFVRVSEDAEGRTVDVGADDGHAIIILPTGDGRQGPDRYADLVNDDLRRDGWTVVE